MARIDLIEQLFNTIIQLRKIVSQRTYESPEEKVATMLQFSALNFIKDQANVTIGDLAEFLQLSKSSATQLIERLVKMELVNRVSDKDDRRVIRLEMTTKGEQERLALKVKTLEKMSRFLAKIPESDIKELIRIHNSLAETIKQDDKTN